jgi:glycosyltransferase involved in cell wall biosynthesis
MPMGDLVTIGIPIYRRLQYLPHVLEVVAAQDYANIELLISDNGMNGNAVRELVDAHYPRPYRFRQNSSTVGMSEHFNQLVNDASGKYFAVLADDDEITPNYVSELVAAIEKPGVSVAISMQETIDESGNLLRSSLDTVPETLSGSDFIRAAWLTHEYGYESFSMFLARTADVRACGAFPQFWKGTAHDDALLVKLSLGSIVAFSKHCAYRKRYSEESDGYGMTIADLARGLREFMEFLDADPTIRRYAASHRSEWNESRSCLIEVLWKTYYCRWVDLYKKRLTTWQWARAAFNLPYIPAYYRAVMRIFGCEIVDAMERRLPWVYAVYRRMKPKAL